MNRHRCLAALSFFAIAAAIGDAQAAKCPNLLIILDKSGSMADAPDNSRPPPGGSKWDLAGKALTKLLTDFDGQLPIGLSMFASDGSCGGGILNVSPDYNTGMQILQKVMAVQPDSATPTSETIAAMRNQKVMQDASRGQFFLLITDGAPNCNDFNPPKATVAAIEAARKQNPSITTFVVGFGQLPQTESMAMDQMAEAGGKPLMGKPHKFYAADNLDDLNAALTDILGIVTGEMAMSCDDSCYSNGCPNPGDVCIRGMCKPNPCASMSCGPGYYCYTDGVSDGRCVAPCKKKCARGARCEMGTCIQDACPAACIAGYICNRDTGRCDSDPLCPRDLPPQKQCKKPSECQYGNCVDEPCQFIKCPQNTRCVPWDGSCEYIGPMVTPGKPDMNMGAGTGDDETTSKRGGCSAGRAGLPENGAPVGAAGLLLLLRRRRRA